MPKKCYSLEINQKGEGIYRIRNKILRSEDMMKLRKIKEMYKEYETFYLDSYENFIAHESIKR